MKLAITGCNGSVGKRIVLLALKRGYTVFGLDLTPLSDELAAHQDKFTFHQIDLKDYHRVLDILQNSECEAVIHLAAFRDPTDYKVQTHNRFGSLFRGFQAVETWGLAMSYYHGTFYEHVQRYTLCPS